MKIFNIRWLQFLILIFKAISIVACSPALKGLGEANVPSAKALLKGVVPAAHVGPKNMIFDFDKPPETRFEIAPKLTVGARLELEYQFEGNFDLDSGDPDDLSFLTSSVSFAFDYAPTEKVGLFLNIEPYYTLYDDEEHKKKSGETLDLKQLYISLDGYLEGLSLRAGRQRFNDKREWIYDDELDGLRLFYIHSNFALDASVTVKNNKDLLESSKGEDITNFILMGIYSPAKDMDLSAYIFAMNDRTIANEDPVFGGMNLLGKTDQFEYWLEASHVTGEAGQKKIRGFGLDLGGTYILEDIAYEPSLTLGYALGSGDTDPMDNTDGNFRQTGLQDNSAKFNGIAKLKYYGEIFDPELSNMHILTLGTGIRPTKDTSVDIVYHFYNQYKASDELRDSGVDSDPDGVDQNLGSEVNLVVGYRAKPHWKGSFILGYFIPGGAFSEDSDNAFFSEIKVRYDF